MKFSKLTLAITGVLSAGATMDATADHAINLYMDSKTKQIYAEPCARCVPLGSFERVEEKQNKPLPKGEEDFADVAKMREDLELQHNEIKALEEHVVEDSKVKTSMDKNGFQIQSADKNFKFRLGGRIHADATFHGNDGALGDANDGTEVRRARMRFEGVFYKDWLFRTEADFADEKVGMKDAYIQYLGYKPITITVGQQKQNFSRELQESSNDMMFTERSLMNILNAPVVDRAIGFNLEHFGGDLTAKLGIFGNSITPPGTAGSVDTTGTIKTGHNAMDEGWGISSRVTYAPINEKGKVVHLGVAGNYRAPDDNGEVSKAKSLKMVYETTNMSDLDVIDKSVGNVNDIKMLGLEAAAIFGPFSAGGEYTRSWIDRKNGDSNIELDGWYAEAAWSITGESRNYKDGNMRYLEPAKPFNFSNGNWGAWELATRYSEANLNDGTFLGGNISNITVALNWYINTNFRFQSNYMRVLDTDANAAIPNVNDLDMFTLRAQVAF